MEKPVSREELISYMAREWAERAQGLPGLMDMPLDELVELYADYWLIDLADLGELQEMDRRVVYTIFKDWS